MAAAQSPPVNPLPLAGGVILALGLVLLAVAAVLDAQARSHAPWPGALFVSDGRPLWDGAVPIQARRVPLNNFPAQEELALEARDRLPREQYLALGLNKTEWLLSVEMPVERFEPLLASGRLPRPGRPEVLAGVYCRANRIQVEDAQFEVVGRLKRGVGGLYSAYILPANMVWDGLLMHTASWGWLDPEGRQHLLDQDDPGALAKEHDIQGGIAPVPPVVTFLSIAGLMVVALGGGLLHWAFFVSRAQRRTGWFVPLYREVAAHPRLVRFMHVFLYGGLFLLMVVGFLFPMGNVIAQEYIGHAFTEGELGYVGRAYESGNIPLAAAATWVNNYLLQTVALTIGLSVIVPFLGVLKAWASFAGAGFGMTPLWSGMSGMLIFHSITMVLELEAYVFACVTVVLFWMKVYRCVRAGERIMEAASLLFAGTVISGVMLAIAALYEAATLILLR